MAGRDRLTLAFSKAGIVLPDAGRIAVFAPRAGADLSALPLERVQVVTGFRPDHDHFAALGLDCVVAPEGRYGAAILFLPRAKSLARFLVATAAELTDGPVIIDGTKTDGIESILKDCRRRVDVSAPLSKAHGKIFSFTAGPQFADWGEGALRKVAGGFVTAPGSFSADGIDPASRRLGDALPLRLGPHVIDLGGGWGYLSARALERDGITRLDLVEAFHPAIECARRNLLDPRVHLHWEDATRWHPETLADTVIMNPPFHESRVAEPALGQDFIRAAAGMLKPSGELWMVANRHLPYETTLVQHFAQVEDMAGDTRFKVLCARRPARMSR